MTLDDDNPIFPDPKKRPEEPDGQAHESAPSDEGGFDLDFDLPPAAPSSSPSDPEPAPAPATADEFAAAATAPAFSESSAAFDDSPPASAADDAETGSTHSADGDAAMEAPVRHPGRALAFGLVVALGTTALTGMGLSFHYAPDAELAHASLRALEQDEPLGALLRTLHWFGSAASIALAILALLWAVLRAEYRLLGTPGWWTGVGAVLLTVAAATTGELLPWDEQAVLATEVRTGLIGIAPEVGDRLKAAVLGGDVIANPTLVRFHALHVAILPALLLGLIWLHIRTRRARAADPDRGLGIPAALFGLLVGGVIGYGAWVMTAPEGEPSAPDELRALLPDGAPLGEVYVAGDEGFVAWPEWYVLWLNKLLKVFPPEYEIVPAVVIPTLLILALLILPWLDRSRLRRFAHPAVLWPTLAVVGGIVGLSIANHIDRPLEHGSPEAEAALEAAKQGPDTPAPNAGETATETETEGDEVAAAVAEGPLIQRAPAPPYSLDWNRLEREGYALVRRHDCMDCHEWDLGGTTYGNEQDGAPPLQEMLRDTPIEEYVEMIADPEAVLGTEDMPAYDHVPEEQLRAIAHFLRRVGED